MAKHPLSPDSRLISILLTISLLTSLLSCATPGPQPFSSVLPSEENQHIRTVAVVYAQYSPRTNFVTFSKGKNAGVGKSATEGALGGAIGGAWASLQLVWCPPCFGLVLPFAVLGGAAIGGVGGAIEGALKSVPADEAKDIEARINSAVVSMNVHQNFAELVASRGSTLTDYQYSLYQGKGPVTEMDTPPYQSFKEQNMDMVIEVGVKNVGFAGGHGSDPEVSFYMITTMKAIRTSDGAVLYSGDYPYMSNTRYFSEWSKDGAAQLRQEFKAAYASLADQVIEDLFLVYDVHVDSSWSTDYYCMLKPYNPPLTALGFFSRERTFAKIDSLLPTLQWEAFPRDKDIKSDSKGILSQVSDISYDLKIWKCENKRPKELIYSRRGIKDAEKLVESAAPPSQSSSPVQNEQTPVISRARIVEHALEMELQPSTEYYWTVRARFKLNGRQHVSRWSYSRIPWSGAGPDPCYLNFIPLTHYHRFKTP